MLRHALAASLFVNTIVCWAQTTSASNTKIVAPMLPLLEVLAEARASGSIEMSAHCEAGPNWHFPNVHSPSAHGGSLLQRVREMFADNPGMQVTQDAGGMIRIIENGTQRDLLNVAIDHIPFESKGIPLQDAAFSPVNALMQILQSPEVVDFMKAHDIELAIRGQSSLTNEPFSDESPHITDSMNHITLSQALDRVLKTFPGIWFFEDCPRGDGKGRSVFLVFLDLKNPGLVEIEEPGRAKVSQ